MNGKVKALFVARLVTFISFLYLFEHNGHSTKMHNHRHYKTN